MREVNSRIETPFAGTTITAHYSGLANENGVLILDAYISGAGFYLSDLPAGARNAVAAAILEDAARLNHGHSTEVATADEAPRRGAEWYGGTE